MEGILAELLCQQDEEEQERQRASRERAVQMHLQLLAATDVVPLPERPEPQIVLPSFSMSLWDTSLALCHIRALRCFLPDILSFSMCGMVREPPTRLSTFLEVVVGRPRYDYGGISCAPIFLDIGAVLEQPEWQFSVDWPGTRQRSQLPGYQGTFERDRSTQRPRDLNDRNVPATRERSQLPSLLSAHPDTLERDRSTQQSSDRQHHNTNIPPASAGFERAAQRLDSRPYKRREPWPMPTGWCSPQKAETFMPSPLQVLDRVLEERCALNVRNELLTGGPM